MWKGGSTGLSRLIERAPERPKDHISPFANTTRTRRSDALASDGAEAYHTRTLSPVDLAIFRALARRRHGRSRHQQIGQPAGGRHHKNFATPVRKKEILQRTPWPQWRSDEHDKTLARDAYRNRRPGRGRGQRASSHARSDQPSQYPARRRGRPAPGSARCVRQPLRRPDLCQHRGAVQGF